MEKPTFEEKPASLEAPAARLEIPLDKTSQAKDKKVSKSGKKKAARLRAREILDPAQMNEKTDRLVGTAVKKWSQYWYRRLKPEVDTLPPNIQLLVRKMIQGVLLTGDEMFELGKYVRARIGVGPKQEQSTESRPALVLDAEAMELESLEYISRIVDQLEEIELEGNGEGEVKTAGEVQLEQGKELDQLISGRMSALKPENKGERKAEKMKTETVKSYIEKLQDEKREVMAQLRSRLADIDSLKDYPEEEQKDRRVVHYNAEAKDLFVFDGQEQRKITFGDIVADLDWGIKYRPAPVVPEVLWRKIRKLCDIAEARQSIEWAYNRELSRMGYGGGSWNFPFSRIEEEVRGKDQKTINGGYGGFIAEKMAKNFLWRMQYSHLKVGFRVENSSVVEDASLKYDFKVRFLPQVRGVAVEPEGMTRNEYIRQKKNIGIQFTTRRHGLSKDRKVVEGMRRSLLEEYRKLVKKPVDDIILIEIELKAGSCFTRWVVEGKPSGGPEQYLTREQKIEIFQKVTEGKLNLSDEEIEKLIV